MNLKVKRLIIDSPPPFLSGKLHIGHYYQYSLIYLLDYYDSLNNNQQKRNCLQGFDVHGLPLELKCRKEEKTKEELTQTFLITMKKDFSILNKGRNTKYWTTSDKKYQENE